MTFSEAVKAGFRNYFVMSGRAGRAEFWWFVLFCAVVAMLIGVFEGGESLRFRNGGFVFRFDRSPIANLWWLATVIPIFTLWVRRLHDLDKSGWWQLLLLIPLVGWVVLLAWFSMRGTVGANRFGPDPLSQTPVR